MAVAALVTWIVTAAFGLVMLGTWISRGGSRDGGASNFPPPVVFGHFLLASGGLILWIVYLFKDANALAWTAFADLLVVATLGDVLVVRWAKDRRRRSGAAGSTTATTRGLGGATEPLPVSGTAVELAEQRLPTPVVFLHGIFAVTTLVLVLLAALEVGGG